MNTEQQSVDVECMHESVTYASPMTCIKCGAVIDKDDGKIKVVTIDELSPEKQAAVRAAADKATVFPIKPKIDQNTINALARPNKKGSWPPRGAQQITNLNDASRAEGITESIEIDLSEIQPCSDGQEAVPVLEGSPQKVEKPKQPVKGAITKIEALSAKERIFVVNGVKFYTAVTDSGFRILSACHESKKTLESAGRVLEMKGWTTKVKRSKEDKSLFTLEAKEKRPSGPWPDEDPVDGNKA